MLVFSRQVGEQIQIGEDVVITVVRVRGRDVQLGFSAPPGVTIHRAEIYDRINATQSASLTAPKVDSA